MKNYIVLTTLALLTLSSAVMEGLIEGLPPQFIQVTGILILLCAAIFVSWVIKMQTRKWGRD